MKTLLYHLALASLTLLPCPRPAAQDFAARPNVLFIAIDDLNHWVGCLGEKYHWRKFALWEETTRAPINRSRRESMLSTDRGQ